MSKSARQPLPSGLLKNDLVSIFQVKMQRFVEVALEIIMQQRHVQTEYAHNQNTNNEVSPIFNLNRCIVWSKSHAQELAGAVVEEHG